MELFRTKWAPLLLVSSALVLAGCDDGDDGAAGAIGPAGTAGAAGPTGAAGAAGADGADGGISAVTPAVDVITTAANDLRGVTYSRVAPHANKIYVSGHVGTTDANRQVVVGRFFADGTPDSSFATDGFLELNVTAATGSGDENALSLTELQGGDLIVSTRATDADGGQSVYLLRITPDGAQAAGWGDADGKVEVVFGTANADNATFPGFPGAAPSDLAWDVIVDPSVTTDRVVVFGIGPAGDGVRTDRDRYVARMTISATGATADPTFNGGEAYTFAGTGTLTDNARRGLVEADGSIVTAGYTDPGAGEHVVLIKLTPAGELDTTFGGFTQSTAIVAATPGIAVFNPFEADGGFAESYAVGAQSTGSYVTTGYGRATTRNGTTPSTLGYEISDGQDMVAFRVVAGTAAEEDLTWGQGGQIAVQSEGQGFPTTEDRGRHLVILPDDRTVVAGRFGGNAAAFVLTDMGVPDTLVFGDGIIELPNATVTSQFFGLALSPDGSRVAMTTNSNDNGARLVVLKVGQ